MGDVYNYSSLLQTLLRENRIESVSMVVPRKYSFIPKMFSNIGTIIEVNADDSVPKGHAHIIYNDRKQRIPKLLLRNLISTLKVLTLLTFLPSRLRLDGGRIGSSTVSFFFRSVLPIPKATLKFSSPDIQCTEVNTDADSLFSDLGLRQGRTLIIAPESNSSSDLSEELINLIISKARFKNFKILFNEVMERGRNDSVSMRIPLHLLNRILEKAGYFISVRSGICDLVSPSKAKKMIIYEANHLEFLQIDRENKFNEPITQLIMQKFLNSDQLNDILNKFLDE